jgi:hypothetical protein
MQASTHASTAGGESVVTGATKDREDEEKSAAAVATAVAAAEALSQRVREAAARMSEMLDQMGKLLLPTPIPLGLAVLFSQYAPPSCLSILQCAGRSSAVLSCHASADVPKFLNVWVLEANA